MPVPVPLKTFDKHDFSRDGETNTSKTFLFVIQGVSLHLSILLLPTKNVILVLS